MNAHRSLGVSVACVIFPFSNSAVQNSNKPQKNLEFSAASEAFPLALNMVLIAGI